MAKDVSIAMSVRDQFTPAVNSMRNSGQAFNKNLEETDRRILAFEQRQGSLKDSMAKSQTALDQASSSLRDAKKAYNELGDEASRINLDKAHAEYNQAKEEVQNWGNAIKDTKKQMQELYEEQNRNRNRVEDNTLTALSQAGLGNMVGSSISGAIDVGIGSAFGNTMGSAISTTMEGIVSGASMGFLAGGLPGAAAGAAVGMISGGINAATQYFAVQDEAFMSTRNEMVENSIAAQQQSLMSGTGLHEKWEADQRGLRTLITEEDTDPEEFQRSLLEIGRTPPFSYDTAMTLSREMLGMGVSTDETLDKINSLADAAVALNLSDTGVSNLVAQLETIQVAGKVETRMFRTLGKMGLNARDILASYLDVAEDEVDGLLEDMEPEVFIDAVYSYFGTRFGGAAQSMEDTYTGLSGMVDSYYDDMDRAMGQGFNETRMEGLGQEHEWLSSGGAEKMEEANRLIGSWEAEQENIREQMRREVVDAIMEGDVSFLSDDLFHPEKHEEQLKRIMELSEEYSRAIAEDNGTEMGRIMKEAETQAAMAYNASDGAQLQLESERALINNITSALVDDRTYWHAGYIRGEAMSEGMMAALKDSTWKEQAIALNERFANSDTPDGLGFDAMGYDMSTQNPRGYAYGLDYVPYDNYLAMLHQGERVQTAQEARSQQAGSRGPANITITGNNIQVRDDDDIDRIARALAEKLQQAQMIS